MADRKRNMLPAPLHTWHPSVASSDCWQLFQQYMSINRISAADQTTWISEHKQWIYHGCILLISLHIKLEGIVIYQIHVLLLHTTADKNNLFYNLLLLWVKFYCR